MNSTNIYFSTVIIYFFAIFPKVNQNYLYYILDLENYLCPFHVWNWTSATHRALLGAVIPLLNQRNDFRRRLQVKQNVDGQLQEIQDSFSFSGWNANTVFRYFSVNCFQTCVTVPAWKFPLKYMLSVFLLSSFKGNHHDLTVNIGWVRRAKERENDICYVC